VIEAPAWMARLPWFSRKLRIPPTLDRMGRDLIQYAHRAQLEGTYIVLHGINIDPDQVLIPKPWAVRWLWRWWRFPQSQRFLAWEIVNHALAINDGCLHLQLQGRAKLN
tara:strand:+ start:653 stop:979 length:327 start_codon:yes stop_codon:yes gene_type:complete